MLGRAFLVAATFALLAGFGAVGSSAAVHAGNGRIAYAHLGEDGKHSQIYTTSAAGTQRHRLTNSRRYSSFAPSYSPNGKRIVFVHSWKQFDLWTMNADGSHLRRLTWTKRIQEDSPAWSPDGNQIAFVVGSLDELSGGTDASTEHGIWLVEADGHGRHRLTNDYDTTPSWSPDGSEIVFDRFDPARQTYGIYVVPAAGGAPTRLSASPQPGGISDFKPAWSPDGSRILFSSDRPDTFRVNLWVMNPDGSDVEQVTSTDTLDEVGGVWSPDGRRIVYVGEPKGGARSWQIYVSNAGGSGRRAITHDCGECAAINDEPSWQPLPG